MAKIYVTMETNADFLPAEQYGEITFITGPNDDMNNTRNSLHNRDLMRKIRMALHKFDQDEDYVIIAGSPYVTALIFMVLGKKCDNIKFLRWSNRDFVYTPVSVSLLSPKDEPRHPHVGDPDYIPSIDG